jgi:hypothetical protein
MYLCVFESKIRECCRWMSAIMYLRSLSSFFAKLLSEIFPDRHALLHTKVSLHILCVFVAMWMSPLSGGAQDINRTYVCLSSKTCSNNSYVRLNVECVKVFKAACPLLSFYFVRRANFYNQFTRKWNFYNRNSRNGIGPFGWWPHGNLEQVCWHHRHQELDGQCGRF